jgi:putative transposase
VIKYQAIDELKSNYSVVALCDYLKVSRSSFYRWIEFGRPLHKSFNTEIADLIQSIFKEHEKGYRYITMQLKRKHGVLLNPKTVLRYMQILGLKSPIRKKRFVSCTRQEIDAKARRVMPNQLNREFRAARPNEKLVTDVSYVYHKHGRLFLSVIKDLYDNSIQGYTLSRFNSNTLVFDNLDLIFNDNWDRTKTCILHSDQGFQYTSKLYFEKLEHFNVIVSHSNKGNCYDNACCENFFSHLKSESLELHVPLNEEALIHQVEDFILWYNYERPQSKLKGMTPIEFRNSYLFN